MNDAPLNSEREQAERLDEWITAAHAGGPPENDTVNELQKLIRIGRAIRADETFARQLEAQLARRHRRKRRVEQWRWMGWAAAVMVAIFFAAGVFRGLNFSESPQSTEVESGMMTPVALAATSTLAVEINASLLPSTTAATAPPTPPPAATQPPGTPAPLLPTMTLRPTTTPAFIAPSMTPLPTSTLLPAVATIVPAVNPTSLPIFQHAQVDVLFVVDSGAGVTALDSRITDLFSQIAALSTLPDTRFGLVMVNGEGVQTVDFTYDSGVLLAALQTAEVAPGAWAAMLDEAAARVSWRANATIKLIIGIGLEPDADYTLPLQQIAAQGITLDLIALGDVADQDALIFWNMVQITGGHFVVLAGSDYTLNEWIVQWIAEELAALRSG